MKKVEGVGGLKEPSVSSVPPTQSPKGFLLSFLKGQELLS